jgi:hypothetical protein
VAELTRPFIALSHAVLSGSLLAQPSGQKVTSDPSLCCQVKRKPTRSLSPFGARFISGYIYNSSGKGYGDYVGLDKNAKLYQHSEVNHFSEFLSVYTGFMGPAGF